MSRFARGGWTWMDEQHPERWRAFRIAWFLSNLPFVPETWDERSNFSA
jgi:hypothetical protein